MRRNSVIKAVALALTLGAAGIAAAQSGARPDQLSRTEQDGTVRNGPGGRGRMLLRGITLSATQQTKLKALSDGQRQRDRQGRTEERSPRARGDTAGTPERRAQRQQRRDQHIAAVRGILDARQRVQFDKNVAQMKAEKHGGGEHGERKSGSAS